MWSRFAKTYLGILLLTPFLCTFIIEFACNEAPETIRVVPILIEIVLCTLIEFTLVGLIPFRSVGLCLCYFMAVVFGLANYFLLEIRDIPFMLMDLKSLGTAMAVAKDYSYELSGRCVISIILAGSVVAMVLFCHRDFHRAISKYLTYKKTVIIAGLATVSFAALVGFVGFSGTFGITMDLWKPGRTYAKNGALSSFVCFAQFSYIEEPEGYDKEEVRRILEEAEAEYDKSPLSLESDVKPTVISIMNEAFGDVSVLGPVECTANHLAFYNSLKSDPGTIWHGYTYVSTYAGGTARTEFEWLTGFSMRLFSNSQPYSQFNFEDIDTYVKDFKANGYRAVAMHPELPTNYRRNTAYEQMGFDDFLSKEVFRGYDTVDFLPRRTSDKGDYDRMIREDEDTDEPVFIHNVTMQNHGGYDFDMKYDEMIGVDNEYQDVTQFRKYETLLALSDEAIEELINYYRESEDHVIICLYGDHLPGLPDDFVRELMIDGYNSELGIVENEERRFKVPFFIWANYDVGETVPGYYHNNELITSPNYLGVVTKADAGLKLTAFDKYLLLLREKIPAINESGYFAKGWHASDEETEYTGLLKEYEYVQHAGMFDSEGLEDLFGFGVADESDNPENPDYQGNTEE